MRAKIKMGNTPHNQEIARQIRNANSDISNPIDISFKKDLTEIYFEGELIWIPKKEWFKKEMLIDGQIKTKDSGLEIQPKDRGKTINLRLNADLVSELNEIRNHVMSKTQHDIVLEIFKKGIDQYNKENN